MDLIRITPDNKITVYVGGQIISRFESVVVSRDIMSAPATFQITYGFSNGSYESGTLDLGSKVEIYAAGQKVMTGYIEEMSNSVSYGEHQLTIGGRSIISTVIDSTTDRPSGISDVASMSLNQLATYMFSGFGVNVVNRSQKNDTYSFAQLEQITPTTKPFDYIVKATAFQGKIIYDDEAGNVVLDDVGTYDSDIVLTNTNNIIKSISIHRSSIGRCGTYSVIPNLIGGIAGDDPSTMKAQVPSPVQDPSPDELPPKKQLTFITQGAYTSDTGDGSYQFQQNLLYWTANTNWGRSEVVTLTVKGFTDPNGDIWTVNSLISVNYSPDTDETSAMPQITGTFVLSSVTFRTSYSDEECDLILVRPEALTPEPIAPTPVLPSGSSVGNNS